MSHIHPVEKRKFFVCSLILILAFLFIFLSPSILSVSALGTSSAQHTLSPLKGGYPKTLTSPNAQYEGWFGTAVAISGKLAVVGAYDETADGYSEAGHAYVYNANTGQLIENLTSPNAQEGGAFGCSVAISGKLAIVGAFGETAKGISGAGHAYVYNTNTWKLIQTLTSPNAQDAGFFGYSVGISGKLAVVGALFETAGYYNDAGHAYVYNADTGELIQTLTSPNAQDYGEFGQSVAISGKLAIVGAYLETANGYSNAGHAYVYNANSGQLIENLTSPNAQEGGWFGESVGISGKLAIVGALGETAYGHSDAGHAYVYNANTGELIENLTSPRPQTVGFFGGSVAISGKLAVVGAPYERADGYGSAGHAYVYNAITGKLIQTLTSPNAQYEGWFGTAVAISGKLAILGAIGEIAGFYQAGHAYLFKE